MSYFAQGLDGASGSVPRSPRNGSFQNQQTPSLSSNSRAPSIWEGVEDDGISKRHQVMVHYLHGRITDQRWFDQNKEFIFTPSASAGPNTPTSSYDRFSTQGVLLRASRGVYMTQPSNLDPNLIAAVQRLNVEVAFTMSTELTNLIFSTMAPGQTEFILPHDSTQYQILDSFEEMARASSNKLKRFQYACFVRKERLVLLWHDEVQQIITHGDRLERQLLTVVWGHKIPHLPNQHSPHHSTVSALNTPTYPSFKPSSKPASVNNQSLRMSLASRLGFGGAATPVEKDPAEITENEKNAEDLEAMAPLRESLDRSHYFMSAVFVGCAICLITILLLGFGGSALLYQCLIDGQWTRMALLATTPFFGLFGLFFAICIFTDIAQVIGPITGVTSNSRMYSSIRPNVQAAYKAGFRPSHITIQMPVYKEGLESVIMPTVNSLKAAISHYELNGGTASIFVNDDGLQLLPEEEAQARRDFYADNNIGWVARPKHGEDGFVRPGKFKKASNMNYSLNISNKTEDVLTEMIEIRKTYTNSNDLTEAEQDELYRAALDKVLDDDGKAWADGDIRMGEYILIIDSDTRVPVDCLLFGAAEMYLSPEVAIVQHSSGVMQVVGDYFENGITFFTNQIYSAIRFAVGSGEAAPFVGHNAFLRWKAIQSVATKSADGTYDLFWSESHVSEDFDISLRLQMAGNSVRLATYHGDEFKEGVSLTVYDELSRWEKYAYGCNELVFNPIYTWPYKSPFTKLFRTLIWSNMQMSSKVTILAYIATYYALAMGLPLTILNYFLIGWDNGYIDTFYIESWKIFVALLVVFSGLGNVCLAILRYRLGEKSLIGALLENFKWMPMFAIFFGGISFHLLMALGAHMFSINMEWGATAKEAEASNFFKEVPKIFKSFKWMYLFCVPMVGGMIYLGLYAPPGWEIRGITAVVPLAVMLTSHIILPFMLNPALMIFNY